MSDDRVASLAFASVPLPRYGPESTVRGTGIIKTPRLRAKQLGHRTCTQSTSLGGLRIAGQCKAKSLIALILRHGASLLENNRKSGTVRTDHVPHPFELNEGNNTDQ